MKIEYFHASKFGNGAMVAEEFKLQMAAQGVTVNIHHIRDAKPKEMPPADTFTCSARRGAWANPSDACAVS